MAEIQKTIIQESLEKSQVQQKNIQPTGSAPTERRTSTQATQCATQPRSTKTNHLAISENS